MGFCGIAGSSTFREKHSGSSWTREILDLLRTAFQSSPLIDPIIEQFKHGRENLDIILWALNNGLPMNDVLEIFWLSTSIAEGSNAGSIRGDSGLGMTDAVERVKTTDDQTPRVGHVSR